jgi:hypothetical protein
MQNTHNVLRSQRKDGSLRYISITEAQRHSRPFSISSSYSENLGLKYQHQTYYSDWHFFSFSDSCYLLNSEQNTMRDLNTSQHFS